LALVAVETARVIVGVPQASMAKVALVTEMAVTRVKDTWILVSVTVAKQAVATTVAAGAASSGELRAAGAMAAVVAFALAMAMAR